MLPSFQLTLLFLCLSLPWRTPLLELLLLPPVTHLRGGGVQLVVEEIKDQGAKVEHPANSQYPTNVGWSDTP